MSYLISDIPAALRAARLALGLTQEQLAAQAGTSQSAIASLERGATNPTVETLARFAAALGVSLEVVVRPLAHADPVIDRYKKDVDRTLLRENLRRSVDDRLRTLAEWQEDLREIRSATKQARGMTRPAQTKR